MANTVAESGGTFSVTFDGSTPWDITTGSGLAKDQPGGENIISIVMIPTAANDTLTVREGGSSGPVIAKWTAADANDTRIMTLYAPIRRKLYVVGNQASSGVVMSVQRQGLGT